MISTIYIYAINTGEILYKYQIFSLIWKEAWNNWLNRNMQKIPAAIANYDASKYPIKQCYSLFTTYTSKMDAFPASTIEIT